MGQGSGKARRGKRGGKNRNLAAKARKAGAVEGKKERLLRALSNFDGAKISERRGRARWDSLGARDEVSASDRVELMRSARWGEANIGLVARAITGPSRLIGYLKPQAETGDPELDKRIEEAWHLRTDHAPAFDMAAGMDFEGWQDWVKRSKIRDGDALTVLTEGPGMGARVMMYEAHQIGDGKREAKKPKNLADGVFLDRFGGRAGFRLLDAKGEVMKSVPRERAIYHADEVRAGRPRQVSGLGHAVSNFKDTVEILGYTKQAVKVAALWAAWLEQSPNAEGEEDPGADLKGFIDDLPESVDLDELTDAVEGATGTGDEGLVLTLDQMIQGGRFQEFAPGQQMKTTNDSRPHPNTLGMLSWLVRDIAWGIGIAPEVLWDPGSINGTGMRYVMAETRRFVEVQQASLRRDCQRLWMYVLAKEIKAGRLDIPAGVSCWWKARWVPQADMTIDRGRDGKLMLELLREGYMTETDYWASLGLDFEEQERRKAWEVKRKVEIAGEF